MKRISSPRLAIIVVALVVGAIVAIKGNYVVSLGLTGLILLASAVVDRAERR